VTKRRWILVVPAAAALPIAAATLVTFLVPGETEKGAVAIPGGQLTKGVSSALLVEPNSSWLAGEIPLCSANEIPATVTSVTATDPAFTVSGFTVRPWQPNSPMEARGGLAANHIEPSS
jgi:hypothetical protein